MKLKQLNEVRYTGKTYYFVQAFDPEDGDLEQYAGPFNDESSAEKFAKFATTAAEKKFTDMDTEEEYRAYIPTFHVQKIMVPQDFLQAMNRHLEQMLG